MPENEAQGPLPVGMAAPEFTLFATPQRKTSLSDWRGSPVVLLFYPADFSPVCGDELTVFSELMPIFHRYGAKVFGVSVDSVWSHLAYQREHNLKFPLLADFHPKGVVARAYNVWRELDGTSERALFVVDPDGNIAWSHLAPIQVNPGADGVLDALERLTSGHLLSEGTPA